jgi:hypothetical protein
VTGRETVMAEVAEAVVVESGHSRRGMKGKWRAGFPGWFKARTKIDGAGPAPAGHGSPLPAVLRASAAPEPILRDRRFLPVLRVTFAERHPYPKSIVSFMVKAFPRPKSSRVPNTAYLVQLFRPLPFSLTACGGTHATTLSERSERSERGVGAGVLAYLS